MGKRNYRVLIRVCVCVSMCVFAQYMESALVLVQFTQISEIRRLSSDCGHIDNAV